jgi:putative ABC transport system permease protein
LEAIEIAGLGIRQQYLGSRKRTKSLLFGVSATDSATFATIALLLTAVALLARWIPARWATKVDPMAAIRCD